MFTPFIAALAVGALGRQVTPIQFVVSEVSGTTHNDSYILPLTDPTHIRYARDKIRYGVGLDKIASCSIAVGADGINRNTKAPGEPLWNWHVTQFNGFVESTAEVMDGWPGAVEGNPDAYVMTGIGFWSYSVTQELGAGPSAPPPTAPTAATATKITGGVRVSWTDKSNNEEGFEIQRQKALFNSWFNDEAAFTVGPNATQVNDSPGAGTFRYMVRSFTINGSSLWSTSKSVKL